MRVIPFATAAMTVALTAGAAAAAPHNINDCEAIQAADAYNHCLASFGPVASGRGKTAPLSYTSDEREPSRADKPARMMIERRHGRSRILLTPRGD